MLAFWLAYILTRLLGANLGDWLACTRAEGGLGLGTAGTSVVFLLAIAATVAYLTITRADVIDTPETNPAAPQRDPGREKVMLGYFAALAVGSAALLGWASAQPHGASPALEKETPVTAAAELPAARSPRRSRAPI